MDIAIRVLKEMQISSNARPNHVSYGTFLRACRKLIREDDVRRDSLMESVFNQCKADGQVGELVLKQLQFVNSPGFQLKLLGKFSTRGDLTVIDLPSEWTSNVKENRSRRSKSKSSFKEKSDI